MSIKSAVLTTGMVDKNDVPEEPQILNESVSRKSVVKKPRAKTKKPSPCAREIIKIKIATTKSIAKMKAANNKRAQARRNGIFKRKPPKLKVPKPPKIKRQLTKQEKIAFANQVAQAQLGKGPPGILVEPVYIPVEPPASVPLVKLVGKKVEQTPPRESTPKKKKPTLKKAKEMLPPEKTQLNGVVKNKTPPKRKLVRKKKGQPETEQENDDSSEILQSAESQSQTIGEVKKRAASTRKPVTKRQTHSEPAEEYVETTEPVQPQAESQAPTNGVVRKRAPKRKLVRKSQTQVELAQENSAAVAATSTLAQSSQPCPPEDHDETPKPVKRRRGRPCKVPVAVDPSITTAVLPQKRGRRLFDDVTKSSHALIVAIREDAKKIEENITRPDSKVSDTFSWVADISSSSLSTTHAANKHTTINGKLATVELVDFVKYPEAASATSSLTSRSASDTMTSPKKRKASHSPYKRSDARPVTKNEEHTKKGHSEKGKEKGREAKRSRHERHDAVDDSKAAPSARKKRSRENKSRPTEERRKMETDEIERLEKEKLHIEELIKNLDNEMAKPTSNNVTTQRKQRDKTATPMSSPKFSTSSSSSGRTEESRSRSSSKTSQISVKDKPKDMRNLSRERPLSTPEVSSLSSSLNPTSSTSISMSGTASEATDSSALRTKMAAGLRRSLDLNKDLNMDTELAKWLRPPKEDDKEDDSEADKPIPHNVCKVLKIEVDVITICRKFKRGIAELSSSEKSIDYKSTQSSLDSQPSCLEPEFETENTVTEPVDTPDAPVDHKEQHEDYLDLHDRDDVLSLHPSGSISGFDSMSYGARRSPNLTFSREPSPFEESREPTPPPVEPILAPIETPPAVKTKTIDVQKQNADSSTYLDTSTKNIDSYKLAQMQTVMESQNDKDTMPLRMGDIYTTIPQPKQSLVFKGHCFYNLVGKCKKADCRYPHRAPNQIDIKNNLTHLSENIFIQEYLLLRRNPPLKKSFFVLYVDECQKRDLTRFLVEMALDAKYEEPTTKTYIMETTLLHLNDKNLESFKDLLVNPPEAYHRISLCDIFMKTIADTQNFSRFRSVFISLISFIVKRNRQISLDVANQIFERICILMHSMYEEALAEAVITLLKNTEVTIFQNPLMNKFLDRVAAKNPSAYEDLVKYRDKVFQDNFETPNGLKMGPPIVENIRYTSPDTTHLEGSHNRPPEDPPAPTITRTVDFGSIPALAPPTPLAPRTPFAPPTPPSDVFVKPAYNPPWRLNRGGFRGRSNGWRPPIRRGGFQDHRGYARGAPRVYHHWK